MPLISFSPSVLNLFGLKINSVDRASTISFGPTVTDNITSYGKINNAFGVQQGDLSPSFSFGLLNDSDFIDNPIGPAPTFENTL